jgi:radical SAM superfamily enzyme YgiQ (UPF0313 family)
MPKLLLIQASLYYSQTGEVCKGGKINLPGLALPLVAALTPKHWEVKLIIEYVEDINFDEDCDLVGIGNMGHSILRANDIALEFKKRGKKVFTGGLMSTLMPELCQNFYDSIILGDAEIGYPKMLDDFEKTGKMDPLYQIPVNHLTNLPLPRYDLLAKKRMGPLMPVQIGRGCPNTCNFCSVSCVYKGKYLCRDINEIIRDIKEIKRLGYKYLFFVDDNIIGKPAFFKEFARQLIPLKMKWISQATISIAYDPEMLQLAKKSGCLLLGIGIESINQDSLQSLNKKWVKVEELSKNIKKIHSYGIMIQSDMIIGTESDTPESLMKTCDFIKKHKIAVPTFSILTPVPGTEQYHKMVNENRIIDHDITKYIGTYCVYKPALMTPKETEDLLWQIYSNLYSYKSIIKRIFFNPFLLKNLFFTLIVFKCNLTYRKSTKNKTSSVIF